MKINIIYSTQMGTTQMIVDALANHLKTNHQVEATMASSATAEMVKNTDLVIFAVPTYDDGQIEYGARSFIEGLGFETGITTRFAVIAPGDSGYPAFCGAYDQIKVHVEKSGMQEIHPVMKIDQYWSNAEGFNQQVISWVDELLAKLN